MHPNPSFRQVEEAENLKFASAKGFGALAVNGPDGPLVSHIPFLVAEDGKSLELHLVRSNPIVRAAGEPLSCVLSVTGPHSYISPDWYEIDDQVPTWNYVAVHLRGKLHRLEDAALVPILERLSARFEGELDKAPWLIGKVGEEALNKMLRMIVPFRMEIAEIAGTWKLNQNKDGMVRMRAADKVASDGIGTDLAELAKLMRDA